MKWVRVWLSIGVGSGLTINGGGKWASHRWVRYIITHLIKQSISVPNSNHLFRTDPTHPLTHLYIQTYVYVYVYVYMCVFILYLFGIISGKNINSYKLFIKIS